MTKAIVLHPKQLEDEEIEHLITRLGIMGASEGIEQMMSAREVFLEFEQKYGKPVNWARWTQHVTGPANTFGKTPRYDYLIVAPESVVGKATADIVSAALRLGMSKILRLTPDGTLVKVTKVVALDPDSFTRGWVVA